MLYNTFRILQLSAYIAVESTYLVAYGYNHFIAKKPAAEAQPYQGGVERCRAKAFRCEQRCDDDTKGGTMARIKCYDRCREDENDCRKYDGGP